MCIRDRGLCLELVAANQTYRNDSRIKERSGRMFLKRQSVRSFGKEDPSVSVLAMRLLERKSLRRFGQFRPRREVMALKLRFTSTRLTSDSKLSRSRRELLERERTCLVFCFRGAEGRRKALQQIG